MNSLIRPALYGSHHDIRNLTRLDEPLSQRVNVVGPICEDRGPTGRRSLAASYGSRATCVLIATCGAYGYAMAIEL